MAVTQSVGPYLVKVRAGGVCKHQFAHHEVVTLGRAVMSFDWILRLLQATVSDIRVLNATACAVSVLPGYHAQGIGEGCSRAFFEAGSNVVICARGVKEGEALAAEFNGLGLDNKAIFVRADVSKVADLDVLNPCVASCRRCAVCWLCCRRRFPGRARHLAAGRERPGHVVACPRCAGHATHTAPL